MEEKLNQLTDDIRQNRADIREIKDNHLKHLGDDINDLKISAASMSTDLNWLKENHWKVIWGLIFTFIASAIGAIFSLLT